MQSAISEDPASAFSLGLVEEPCLNAVNYNLPSRDNCKQKEALQLNSIKAEYRKTESPFSSYNRSLYLSKKREMQEKNRSKLNTKQSWSLKEDYFLMRSLMTSPYGINSIYEYLPEHRTIQSYRSRIIHLNKKYSTSGKQDGELHSLLNPHYNTKNNTKNNKTCLTTTSYPYKASVSNQKALITFVSITRQVLLQFNISNIKDFIKFERKEICLPVKFQLEKDNLENLAAMNNVDNNLNVNKHVHESLSNSIGEITTEETVEASSTHSEQLQLLKTILSSIVLTKEKLIFDTDLLQTQLFKSYKGHM